MSTHGTIAIRRNKEKEDEIFVFHALQEGSLVEEFMKENPSPKSIDDLILDAFRFCTVRSPFFICLPLPVVIGGCILFAGGKPDGSVNANTA